MWQCFSSFRIQATLETYELWHTCDNLFYLHYKHVSEHWYTCDDHNLFSDTRNI